MAPLTRPSTPPGPLTYNKHVFRFNVFIFIRHDRWLSKKIEAGQNIHSRR